MIEFQHVSFSYEKDRPVIEDLSFRIERGESVGLIGANGAGKSTVMKLLLGLIAGEGKIFVDGIEVNKASLSSVRRRLGFVLQNSDNQMFMPTVYEDMIFAPLNYGLSREEAERRVDAVLEQLGLSPSQLAAFGDGDNDAHLLELAEIGIAVANATPACRAVADYITKRHDEDGLAYAIYHILKL